MKPKARTYYEAKKSLLPDASDRSFQRKEIDPSAIHTVHITGICGTAMGSTAKLFSDAGFNVSGSDTGCYPPMSDIIKELGITFHEGFNEKHVVNKDLVIVANMFGPDNIEGAYVRTHERPQMSIGEALGVFFIENKTAIVIAGTHGKTTTTGLMTHVFQHSGQLPSYLVGGVMKNTNKSAQYYHDSKHFIIEGDEYDTAYFDKAPKFLHYKPKLVIITSIELDHIDIYKDIEDYTNAFRFLIEETKEDGVIFVCNEDSGARTLAKEYSYDKRIVLYGLDPSLSLYAKNIEVTPEGQTFEVVYNTISQGRYSVPLFGTYNLLNTLAVIGTALSEKIPPTLIQKALVTFEGLKRRQEIFGEKNGITVLDDFAHHPTAVIKTLKGIRDHYPNRRIVVFFEPRSNTSRSKIFEDEYSKSFHDADVVIISTPKQKDGYTPPEFMNTEHVVEKINLYTKAYGVSNAEEAITIGVPLLKKNDIVVVMSNGSFDGIHQKILDSIT